MDFHADFSAESVLKIRLNSAHIIYNGNLCRIFYSVGHIKKKL